MAAIAGKKKAPENLETGSVRYRTLPPESTRQGSELGFCSEFLQNFSLLQGDLKMVDKDRIKGSGRAGDKKTGAEGKAGQAKGKMRNAVGGLKDGIRGK